MSIISIVTNNVKQVRYINNHSVRFLSKELGISASQINRMENGERAIPVQYLESFSRYYNIDIILLFIPVDSHNLLIWESYIRSGKRINLTLEDIVKIIDTK